MIWLHTYTGLFGGWLLFTIFLTGSLSYYTTEITHWLTNTSVNKQSQLQRVNQAAGILKQHSPDADRWRIQLPNERGSRFIASYQKERDRKSFYLEDEVVVESVKTQGGNFFRTFHYTVSLRQFGGRYITGVAAMLMLIGVFTGIYTHRRFFKDFFTLRPEKKRQFLIDFHAISGIVTIPFCFVICLSALFIYINLYQPIAVKNYFDSYRNLDSQVSTSYPPKKTGDEFLNENINFSAIWQQLSRHWGNDFTVDSVTINNPDNKEALIIVNKSKQANLSNKFVSMAFDYQGSKLADIPEERLARTVRRIFYGLHEAHFASTGLRAMLFGLGLLSTILISTGLIIWLDKRLAKKNMTSYQWIDKLNNACFYGLLLAIAAYLLTTKSGMASTPERVEQTIFFYTWLVSLIIAIALPVIIGKSTLIVGNTVAYSSLLIFDLFGPEAKFQIALIKGDIPHLNISLLLLFTCTWLVYATQRQIRNTFK